MRCLRRNVEKVARTEIDEAVPGIHFHLAIQTVKQFGHLLMKMAWNRSADRALSEQSDKDSVAVALISEDGVKLITGNHAFTLAGGKNEGNHPVWSGRRLRWVFLLGMALQFQEFRISGIIEERPVDGLFALGIYGARIKLAEPGVRVVSAAAETPRQYSGVVIHECIAMRRSRRNVDVVSGRKQIAFAGQAQGKDAFDHEPGLVSCAVAV